MIFTEKSERKIYVKQEEFLSHIKPPSWLFILVISIYGGIINEYHMWNYKYTQQFTNNKEEPGLKCTWVVGSWKRPSHAWAFLSLNIYIYKLKYKTIGVQPIRAVKSNFLSGKGTTLEMCEFTIRDWYLYSVYEAHYVYIHIYTY